MRRLSLLAAAAALLVAAAPASARTFEVVPSTDVVDDHPGDGICAAFWGACTLRAAVQEANASPGPDAIVLPADTLTLSIPGTFEDAAAQGDLDVAGDLALYGLGARRSIIDGGHKDRVLHVLPGVVVSVTGVTIRNGSAPPDDRGGPEGGGGILNRGTLTVSSSAIVGNDSGANSLYESDDGGGGIAGLSGSLTIERSTIAGNRAVGSGGGIYSRADLTVTNSTISTNESDLCNILGCGAVGGGLYQGALGHAQLENVTVAANKADESATEAQPGNDIGRDVNATVSARNTIVQRPAGETVGCNAPITSLGHNIERDDSCGFHGTGDKVNTDAGLGPLHDNGGQTDTHAVFGPRPPFAAGPAFDAGAGCPSIDQRGAARPAGAACDIGAYESGSSVPADPDADGRDLTDNCASVANPDQADADGDGTGDVCDPTPQPPAAGPQTNGDQPQPQPQPGVVKTDPPRGAADTIAPVLARLKLKPRGFRARSRGARFSYALSEAATVKVVVERAVRHGRRTRFARTASLSWPGKAGVNSARLGARAGRRWLAPGSYRATFVASDGAGNASAPKRISFRVLRPR
jgi:predicted outer membrane repeat protein